MSERRVIVIGGGVIGTACAYYLARDGWRVAIVEQGAFGKGCSHGNCGFVSPSHVLPLAMPGAIRMALRSLFDSDSAFYVKPRFDLALWGWLWRFARRCNHRDMLDSGHAIQALLNSSRRLYDELMRDEPIDCEWQPVGILFVFQTDAGMKHNEEVARLLHETFHVESTRYDGDALNALEPALKPGLAGGWHFKGDAHLRPDCLLSSWRRALEAKGVEIREQCPVRGFVEGNGQASALATDAGEMKADAFVVATGAWTPLLQSQLGGRVLIQPGKGYSITMKRPAVCPALPLLFEEHRVAITPMHTGYRIGSTMEFAGYDTTLNRRRLEILKRGTAHYLREPFGEPVEEEWFGWRPMTPDSKPIIDRSPLMRNVVIAAGHNMLGLSMAPATGKLVAEMLGERATHIDLSPYAIGRF